MPLGHHGDHRDHGVTLEGATLGLNALFTPDFLDWAISESADAYGGSSSPFAGDGCLDHLCLFTPRKTDLNNSALSPPLPIAALVPAAIGVFGILGYMATQQNVPIDDVVTQSVGYLVAFPQSCF